MLLEPMFLKPYGLISAVAVNVPLAGYLTGNVSVRLSPGARSLTYMVFAAGSPFPWGISLTAK